MGIKPFSIPFSQAAVDDLRARLGRTRWPDQIQGSAWEYGVDFQFLREICGYWRDQFDWKAQVEKLSAFHHYRYMADGFGIHFIHERGKGSAPIPLILTHGWPGSFLEMLRIIPLLTDPANNGGDPSDSFDVVVPSMPGYGFSDRPIHRGLNTFAIAASWARLMTELGYSRFAAQGGDIGAGVSTILGLRHAPESSAFSSITSLDRTGPTSRTAQSWSRWKKSSYRMRAAGMTSTAPTHMFRGRILRLRLMV